MAFPSLHLSREAFLTAVEFGTQELPRPAQVRLQVLRPTGQAGGTLSWRVGGCLRGHMHWSLGSWMGLQP